MCGIYAGKQTETMFGFHCFHSAHYLVYVMFMGYNIAPVSIWQINKQ